MSDRLYFPVPDECDNMLAQRFLRDKCGLSARIITRLKREKDGILIDGKILRTIDCVQSGKTVSIAIPDEKCKIEPTKGKLDIRYEDDHFLVVNKPHSMPVHPVKQHQSDTLANIVSYYCSQNGKTFVFRAINRLDKDTSGLVLIAKNRFTANAVKNKTHKVYYALCEGEINTEGVVDKPMDLRDDSKMVRIVRDDGMKIVATHRLVKEPYALVYFFSNSYKVRRMLEKFCEKRGLKLVLIPYAKQEFNLGDHRGKCVRLDNVGPSEFVSAIKYADYVFTDSFHGAVFSIIHGKQFYVFERNKKGHVSMNSRLYDLLDTFHLRNRLLAMDSSVEDIDDIDYKQVDSILTKEKEKSTNFLKKALEG